MTHQGWHLSHNQKVMTHLAGASAALDLDAANSLSYAACDPAVIVKRHMWHCTLMPASVLLQMKRDIAEGHCSS